MALLSVFSTRVLVEQLLTTTAGDSLDLDSLDEKSPLRKLFRLGDGLFKRRAVRPSLNDSTAGWRTLHDPYARGGAVVQAPLRVVSRRWLQ